MTVDVHDAIAPLSAEWDALADRVAAPPFARPGWFAAWWRAFGTGAPVVVAVRRHGRLAGVLPLRRRARAFASAANVHTPAFPILAEDGAAGELVTWVFSQHPSRVQLDYLDARDPALDALFRASAVAGQRVLCMSVQRSPYATFAAGEDVDGRLTAKAASNLRRNRRRLEEAGRVEFDVTDEPDRLVALLDEGFRLESSGWKAERGTAILLQPRHARLLHRRRSLGDRGAAAAARLPAP